MADPAGVRYAFDELNHLVLPARRQSPGAGGRDAGEALAASRIVEGRVHIDRNNRLHYHARSARGERQDYLLDGTWTLSPMHQLGVLLHPTQRNEEEALFLKGSLVDVKDDALVVSLVQQARQGEPASQRVELSGRWQADDRNRLAFLVARAHGGEDRLVFDGAWTVDEHQQLLYRIEQPTSGRRGAAIQTLRFAGQWQVRSATELAYRLDVTDRSNFQFRVALQSPTLNASDGRIVYQAGIQLSDGRTVERRIVLFGTWKLNRDLSVSFEMPQVEGRRYALTFTGRYAWGSRDAVAVEMSTRDGKPAGLAVTFSRSWVNDATLFLRLERLRDESRIMGGVQIRF